MAAGSTSSAAAAAAPTVVLVFGLGNAGDVWSFLNPGVRGPAVFAGVAGLTRVCAYDRPNTYLQTDQPGRSDPVRQPQGAGRAVADLHALLRAGDIPGPYVLVGHSYGGLIARLYASTIPARWRGWCWSMPRTSGSASCSRPSNGAPLARSLLEPPPGFDPPLELFDVERSYDQMLRAKAARPLRPTMPLVVLSRALAQELPPDLFVPPLPDPATVERAWQTAQDWLGAILPYARHVIARRSSHYIQNTQPKLVIDAVRRELRMVRAVAVRCRGGTNRCRARVNIAGGASDKRVRIRLSDRHLRFVSVRPSRRSLRGTYGLSEHRLRRGGRRHVVTLDAAQSIRRGSYLTFTFRATRSR